MRLQLTTSQTPETALPTTSGTGTLEPGSSRPHRHDVGFYAPSLAWRLAGVADTGGAETQLMLVSRALAELGFDVSVAAFDVPGLDIPPAAHGVHVVLRPTHLAGGSIVGQVREAAAVWAAVRRLDSDVIVTRCAGFWVGIVGLSARLSGRRFVYSSASLLDFQADCGLRKWRDRLLFRAGVALAQQIVVQTEEQVELCTRRFGRIPALIKSIAEPGEPSEAPADVFVWTGRIEPNKDPLAFVELARALPTAKFRMLAPRPKKSENLPLWSELEHAAEELPNLDLGPPIPRPELLRLFGRSVAVVSTSGLEGMPNVFLEAWSQGVPVLALNHDPDGVISGHGLGGFAEGRFERLVELAGTLWAAREERTGFDERCRDYVELHHSAEIVGRQWVEALELTGHSSAAPAVVGAN
jgi:glycosyltransferase involved in cell wall biosynthesis